MPKGRDFATFYSIVATTAYFVSGVACLCAGRCFFVLCHILMSKGRDNCLGTFCLTNGAFANLIAIFRACRLNFYRLGIFMSGCSNNALSHNNRVANRTVLALGETGLLTGCRDRGINDHGVTGCICICVFIAVSARACMCGVSILGAGRRCDHCGVFIGFNAAGYNINDQFFFTAITCRAFCNSYGHHSVSSI